MSARAELHEPLMEAEGSVWRRAPFPGRLGVPTMLHQREIDYLHWVGSAWCSGAGLVCELGSFLGGSTRALATGLSGNPRGGGRMLTYDAFEMDEGSARLFNIGVAPGESFRRHFEFFVRDHLDAVTVREGWIPAELDGGAEERLYPERAPIEVLFVDAAKRWAVHGTILRCFGRWLIPGRSLLIQQDFKHHATYWIPIHMHRLRGCFEPAHDVRATPTLSFVYRGGLEGALDDPLLVKGVREGEIDPVWDEVEAYWRERAGDGVMSVQILAHLRLARAAHHADAGSVWACLRGLEAFCTCDELLNLESGSAATVERDWQDCLDTVARRVTERRGEAGEALKFLDRISELRTRPLRFREDAGHRAADRAWRWRELLWRQVALRCREAGWKRIALYGAGRHTARLLESGWPHGVVEVVVVFDDHAGPGTIIGGVPVASPLAGRGGFDALVLSSDAYEEELAAGAARWLGDAGIPVVRVYTCS